MTAVPLLMYAIWSDAPQGDLLKGLARIHAIQSQSHALVPAGLFRFDDAHLPIGPGFVLFLAEVHWSPHDISGFLKRERLVPAGASVMAVVVDTKAYYLPWEHLPAGVAPRLRAFVEFHGRHHLVRGDT